MSDTESTEPIIPVQPRKSRRWPWITAIPVALAAGVAIGFAVHQPETVKVPTQATEQKIADMERRSDNLDQRGEKYEQLFTELEQREESLDGRETSLDERQASLDEREASISQQEEIVAQNTITDGVWTVGVDVKSGTYRASGVSSDCYWAITTTGSNGTDIVQNGLPGGGNPSVTLSEGQDFESARCGEWHLQQQ